MDRKELKRLLPYGYGRKIAKRVGVSEKSVSLFINGKSNSPKIEIGALEVLAELNSKRRLLISQIKH